MGGELASGRGLLASSNSMNDLPISVVFDSFQGGRFYRGRYVYTVTVEPPVIPAWWTPWIDREKYQDLYARCKTMAEEKPRLVEKRTRRRSARYANAFSLPEGSPFTKMLFGLTASEFFYRQLRNFKLWAVDRGKGGKWFCEASQWPLVAIPRSKQYRFGRIPTEWEYLFSPMFDCEPNGYLQFDFGPDRKPRVWVCNLCGRTAEWKDWPTRSTPGLANSDYISTCPQCHAERGDFFKQIQVALSNSQTTFKPEQRMQDDYYFTI